LPYLPAGTDWVLAIARCPSPSSEASAKLGAILAVTLLSAGATRTMLLPSRLLLVSGLIRFFFAR